MLPAQTRKRQDRFRVFFPPSPLLACDGFAAWREDKTLWDQEELNWLAISNAESLARTPNEAFSSPLPPAFHEKVYRDRGIQFSMVCHMIIEGFIVRSFLYPLPLPSLSPPSPPGCWYATGVIWYNVTEQGASTYQHLAKCTIMRALAVNTASSARVLCYCASLRLPLFARLTS